MCVPHASAAVERLVPPLAVVIPSTVQSTLITDGSTTLTVSVAGLFTAPAGGSAESIGVTARQMLKIICSRETELKLVLRGIFARSRPPNKLFIIELQEGRYCP